MGAVQKPRGDGGRTWFAHRQLPGDAPGEWSLLEIISRFRSWHQRRRPTLGTRSSKHQCQDHSVHVLNSYDIGYRSAGFVRLIRRFRPPTSLATEVHCMCSITWYSTSSLPCVTWNRAVKYDIWNHLALLLSVLHWHVKVNIYIILWKRITLKIDVTGPENILFACASVHLSARKFYRLGQWRGFVQPVEQVKAKAWNYSPTALISNLYEEFRG